MDSLRYENTKRHLKSTGVAETNLGSLGWGPVLCLCSAMVLPTVSVRAQTGVADERVSLPDGPGSVGGGGENLPSTSSDHLGAMTYILPLEVPEGFASATPELSLHYNSMAGNGLVGVGWDLGLPHIERMTRRGLPHYDGSDTLAAPGGEELVRVGRSHDGAALYRARFEGGFVRYSWFAEGAGRGGYWLAESPDGTRAYFGADSRGREQRAARVRRQDGAVFRYLLVETVDRFDHRVRYDYEAHGGQARPHRIRYLFADGGVPGSGEARYELRFEYQSRTDVVSSGLPGFEVRLSQRLSGVSMLSFGQDVRSYSFHYEQAQAGMSRLSTVRQHGSGGEPFPVVFKFEYSPSLDLDCSRCARPSLFSMGTLSASAGGGVDVRNGRATLLDLNGDALPDLVDTGEGVHRFYFNALAPDGSQRFSPVHTSELSDSSFKLDDARVQAADLNGDGFVDLFHAGTGRVLCNDGGGDWVLDGECRGSGLPGGLAEDEGDVGDTEPQGVRFFDYDGDRRVDLLRTASPTAASVWRNRPEGIESREMSLPGGLGRAFDQGPVQLADRNGDGLLDLVEVGRDGRVWTRIYLGYGRWKNWPEQRLQGSGGIVDFDRAELQDLNGDGLDDVVLVMGNAVHWALSRGESFLPLQTLRSEHVGRPLPDASRDDVSVWFADMNGSGTIDVVWLDAADASVQVLELFELRPNLLVQIQNGIGGVERIDYESSARLQARDRAAGRAWRHPLPQSIQVVTARERVSAATPELPVRRELTWRDGYYDAREHRFAGFAHWEERTAGDASQSPAVRVRKYDVGDEDRHRQGLLELEVVSSGGVELYRVHHRYADSCPLEDVPSQVEGVRFVCEVATETMLREGRPANEWVTLRTEMEYDGYGNVTRYVDHGVVGRGSSGTGGCGACRAPTGTMSGACDRGGLAQERCLGDEWVRETLYVAPGPHTTGRRWNLHSPSRQRSHGGVGEQRMETLWYYDGLPFRGLQGGYLTRGEVTRMCVRENAEAAEDCVGDGWVEALRVATDRHGNVVTELDPLGAPDHRVGHRRSFEYEAQWGLRLTAATLFPGVDASAKSTTPYRLKREIRYHPLFDTPVAVTRWMLQGTTRSSEPGETLFDYDVFGRLAAMALPGDTLDAPTQQFAYHPAAPVSRLVVRRRSRRGGTLDLEQVHCVDGLGRALQTRTRVDGDVYQVSGFQDVNALGLPSRLYQDYQSDGGACEVRAPAHLPFTAIRRDGVGRILTVVAPDAELYGPQSEFRWSYAPLEFTFSDSEDNDPASDAHATPRRVELDGLGRVVRSTRGDDGAGRDGGLRVLWDGQGRFAGYLDAWGFGKRQRYDLMGRMREVQDPDTGRTVLTYDRAGNLVSRRDARGRVVRMQYDGLNRLVAAFDTVRPEATRLVRRYDFAAGCDLCTHGEGRLVQAHYPLGDGLGPGEDALGFDVRGRQVALARTLDGRRFVRSAVHDNAGRTVQRVYPDGTVVRSQHDGLSRVVAVEGVLSRVTYDGRGLVRTLRFENGVRTHREYDVRGRLVRTTTFDGDRGRLLDFRYGHDRLGNVRAVESGVDESHGQWQWGVQFQHDSWYRVTRAFYADGESLAFDFDALDNLTRKASSRAAASPAHVGTYAYDRRRPHMLVEAGTTRVEHDQAGHVTRRGSLELAWDHQGELQDAHTAWGGEAHYATAVAGERVYETHDGGVIYRVGQDFEVRDGIAVTHVRLGDRGVARLSSRALVPRVLADLNDDAHVDVGDAWTCRRLALEGIRSYLKASARNALWEARDSRRFLHVDHLQSVIVATDDRGKVRGERAFYPMGGVRWSEGMVGERGFTGQSRDPTTDLVHFGFRDLDVQTGRWAAPDPLFATLSAGALSRVGEATAPYAYVAGGFATHIDPSGLVAQRPGATNHGGRGGSAARPRPGFFQLLKRSVKLGFQSGLALGPVRFGSLLSPELQRAQISIAPRRGLRIRGGLKKLEGKTTPFWDGEVSAPLGALDVTARGGLGRKGPFGEIGLRLGTRAGVSAVTPLPPSADDFLLLNTGVAASIRLRAARGEGVTVPVRVDARLLGFGGFAKKNLLDSRPAPSSDKP